MRADDPDFVFYVETRGKGGFFLRASPIDVSRIIRESLFDR
jgi:Rad3-related DNA helicase